VSLFVEIDEDEDEGPAVVEERRRRTMMMQERGEDRAKFWVSFTARDTPHSKTLAYKIKSEKARFAEYPWPTLELSGCCYGCRHVQNVDFSGSSLTSTNIIDLKRTLLGSQNCN